MTTRVTIGVKHGKETHDVECDVDETGATFKARLFSLTNVPIERIKVTGLRGGRPLADDAAMRAQGIEELARRGKKLLMLGSAATLARPAEEVAFLEDLPERERDAECRTSRFHAGTTLRCAWMQPQRKRLAPAGLLLLMEQLFQTW